MSSSTSQATATAAAGQRHLPVEAPVRGGSIVACSRMPRGDAEARLARHGVLAGGGHGRG